MYILSMVDWRSVREVCRESWAKWVVVEERREVREDLRELRREDWVSRLVWGGEVEELREEERLRGGVVWVAMSRWKSSVGSESMDSVSEVSLAGGRLGCRGGM